jgi:hypothetical protein
MPIIRVDVPAGHGKKKLAALYQAIERWIAAAWAKEHIWISLREKFSPPGNRQVIVTVDLRPGRGKERERLRVFFDGIQKAFKPLIGTTPEDLIVLIRDFPQHACLSGGDELPPLKSLTPKLRNR